MFNKFKELLQNKKQMGTMFSLALMGIMLPNFASAAGGQSEAVTSALQTVATDIISTITAIAPVALSIVGIMLTWRYGMKFFKSVSK